MKKILTRLIFGEHTKIKEKEPEKLLVKCNAKPDEELPFNEWVLLNQVSILSKERLDHVTRKYRKLN